LHPKADVAKAPPTIFLKMFALFFPSKFTPPILPPIITPSHKISKKRQFHDKKLDILYSKLMMNNINKALTNIDEKNK
jgi:hypothetical protein